MKKIILSFIVIFSAIFNQGQATMTNSQALLELLNHRHSGRSYDATRPVTKDQIQAIIEAGKLAPSSYNEQPWTVLIVDRNSNQEAYDKVFKSLVAFNQGWAKDAPILKVGSR